MTMSIDDIKQAIIDLSGDEFTLLRQLRRWMADRDWEAWDREIEVDSAAGKLDFLDAEVEEAKRLGTLQDL